MEKISPPLSANRRQKSVTQNLLSSVSSLRIFIDETKQFLAQASADDYCMAAVDVLHFGLFNKFLGRDVGVRLLRHIADCLENIRKQYGGVTGYFEGDNFCIIMPSRKELVTQLWDGIHQYINELSGISDTLGVLPVIGVCLIDDPALAPEIFYDRATLALSNAVPPGSCIVYYRPEMESFLEEEMSLLMEITEALDLNEFTFFAQPQIDIFSGKVVGAEALVRWRHGSKGLISPGSFIPALERSNMIYLLDRQIWEKVCQWLKSWIDRGYQPVPISVNISRIDIMSFDVPDYLIGLLEKYDLPAKYIKAEITESAYAEESQPITSAVSRLQDAGFLVMMDDFGSGYSSLNMLKSIPVDVLKIDMRFLAISEDEEQKGIGILESIINMARLMHLPIIVEGVETMQQENILRDLGCRYTQGFYYFKPLPIDQFENLLADERRLDLSGLHCKQVEAFHMREFMDGNLFTDTMINSILGPSAIYDVYDNQVDMTRVNEQYYQLFGLNVPDRESLGPKLWNSVRDDDRPLLLSLLERAYEQRSIPAEGNIHYLKIDGTVLWLHNRIFFLREKEGHRIFFVSLSDLTYLREKRKARARKELPMAEPGSQERRQLEQYYGGIPCGYGLSKVILDKNGEPAEYRIVYINREMERMCGSDFNRIQHLILKAFGDNAAELLRKAYQAAFLGETLNHYAYSSLSNHYLQLTLFQHEYGYVGCLLQDVTHMQLQEGAFNSMVLAYREVYYLHLQDNHCRMLYPDGSLITERGNYEAMVDRHFGCGKILGYDEKNVRHFLSLENLRASLQTQNSVEYRYRRRTKESPDEWCLTSVTINERKNGIPLTAVMTIRSIDNIIREEAEHRQVRMAESLANMSDAFFIYRAVEDERILYANPAVMEIFGCESMSQFMELVGYSFRGMVHPEDLDRVEWEIENQIQHSDENMDYVQYRIIRKDGQIRWVDDCGHLENSRWGEEHRLFYVFIKDITDQITSVQKEKLIHSNQFYHDRQE